MSSPSIPTRIRFSPVQETIVRLLSANPEGLSIYDLIEQVYNPWNQPETAKQCIHVQLYHIRRILRPFGLTVSSKTGRGYSNYLVSYLTS